MTADDRQTQRADAKTSRTSGGLIDHVSWFVCGEQRSTYLVSRWVFLRGLGVVYLIAFVSLGTQVIGLIGENGILPTGEFLERMYQARGTEAYRLLPTLCWFTSSDTFLRFQCWGGVVLSVLLIAGIAPAPVLALLWIVYLSLTVVGQTFLSF